MAIDFYDWLYYDDQPSYLKHLIFIPTSACWVPTTPGTRYEQYILQAEEENAQLLQIDLEASSNEAKFLWDRVYHPSAADWQPATAVTTSTVVKATTNYNDGDGKFWAIGDRLISSSNRTTGSAPFDADTEAPNWERAVNSQLNTTTYRRILDHIRCKWIEIIYNAIPTVAPSIVGIKLAVYLDGNECNATDLARCNDAVSDITDLGLDFPIASVDGIGVIEAEYPGLKTYVSAVMPALYEINAAVNFTNVQVPRFVACKEYWQDTGVAKEIIPCFSVEYQDTEAAEYGDLHPYADHRTWIDELVFLGCRAFSYFNFSYGDTDIGESYDAVNWGFAKAIAEFVEQPFPTNFPMYAEISLPTPATLITDNFRPFPIGLLPEDLRVAIGTNAGGIRVYDELGHELARHIANATGDGATLAGTIFYNYTSTRYSGSKIRVYGGDDALSDYAATDPYGQHAAYPSIVWGAWLGANGDDATVNARDLGTTGTAAVGPYAGYPATDFNGSQINRISGVTPPAVFPSTMIVAMNSDSATLSQVPIAFSTEANANHYMRLDFDGASTDTGRFVVRDSATNVTTPNAAMSAGSWYVLAAEYAAAASRKIYQNGVETGATTNSKTVAGSNSFEIGAFYSTNAVSLGVDGKLSMAMVLTTTKPADWHVDIDAAIRIPATFYATITAGVIQAGERTQQQLLIPSG